MAHIDLPRSACRTHDPTTDCGQELKELSLSWLAKPGFLAIGAFPRKFLAKKYFRENDPAPCCSGRLRLRNLRNRWGVGRGFGDLLA